MIHVAEPMLSERLWKENLRRNESPNQLNVELPLVGAPGLTLLLALKHLLLEVVEGVKSGGKPELKSMAQHRLIKLDRSIAEKVFSTYDNGQEKAEDDDNQGGSRVPRYHLLISQPAVCIKGQLYLVDNAGYSRLIDRATQYNSNLNTAEFFVYNCFPSDFQSALRQWVPSLFSQHGSVAGHYTAPVSISTNTFLEKNGRNQAKLALDSTLNTDYRLYCQLVQSLLPTDETIPPNFERCSRVLQNGLSITDEVGK